MNSLEKMLSLIDIVEAAGGLDADALLARSGLPRSTLYRYLKVLAEAGLITSLPELGYTLGPRVAELDHAMRLRDPLITASRPVMQDLVRAVPGIALLCRRYQDKVLCVHQEAGTDAFHSHYERGYARPLLKGAASRIILAYTPTRTVTRLYAEQPEAFVDAGLGHTLADVKTLLARLRRTRCTISSGQVTPGVTGVAAPILDGAGNCLGSLSLTLARPHLSDDERLTIGERVMFCASAVSQALRFPPPGPDAIGSSTPVLKL
ncbi:IclR family transcriptional regulator [Pigmentiphaga litoralis]|uniref:DNA-binding IclR family transcriptional regulator n=1 Tax=Pigmentiphaga litoralis TaxID=516702 RepID=A0A7Y9LNW3_9BURK|nr:IclR family transcriptional regulator [Pigmentiphaga litoralis]NYE22702.1 DNA-binding IclR family transcriptional regulator [Pigmentiphaga litoralis]NYE83683.1 DNA-binding IclR family transcriptional regulator [Pigmentiphaga litoralis]